MLRRCAAAPPSLPFKALIFTPTGGLSSFRRTEGGPAADLQDHRVGGQRVQETAVALWETQLTPSNPSTCKACKAGGLNSCRKEALNATEGIEPARKA